MALGGFAEVKEDIDGTEEEFNAFNYCLASEYFAAMVNEDFDELEELGPALILTIQDWLNYDGEIGKNEIEDIKKLTTGTFLTYKNRTFIDAIIDNKQVETAETYIGFGNNDPRLYALVMSYDCYEVYNCLNQIHGCIKKTTESYMNFLKSVFDEVEKIFDNIKDNNEKIKVLNNLKGNLLNFRYPKEIGTINVAYVGDYRWVKQLLKTMQNQ